MRKKEAYKKAEESVKAYCRTMRGIEALRAKIKLLERHKRIIKKDINGIESIYPQIKDKYKEKATTAMKALKEESKSKDKEIEAIRADIERRKLKDVIVSDIVRGLDKERQRALTLRYTEGLSCRLVGLELGLTEWQADRRVRDVIEAVSKRENEREGKA